MTATLPAPFVDAQLRRLERELLREHDQVPASVVRDVLEDAKLRFADAAIPDFVPLLVERAARADLVPPDRVQWARDLARRLLAEELPRRWAHTQGVARQAMRIAPLLTPRERPLLVAAAWVHDIGYAKPLALTGFHQLDGARYLLRRGVSPRLCALVAHHAGAAAVAEIRGLTTELADFADERSRLRDALWYCDMTTSPDGRPVEFTERMRELRARRAPDDPVIRALDINEPERAAAVRRTESRLRRRRQMVAA